MNMFMRNKSKFAIKLLQPGESKPVKVNIGQQLNACDEFARVKHMVTDSMLGY